MDDRDAGLDGDRRWFYGGTPPAEPPVPAHEAKPNPVDEPTRPPTVRT